MKKIIIILFLFLIVIQFATAAEIPIINSYATDKAGILSLQTKAELESVLRNLEKVTDGVQFVVYIENEYPKEFSLEEYTLRIAEENQIGKKRNDNGILLYVSIKDREYRWEVGYGVEGTLSASLLGRISRNYILPNFKEGNYEKGVLEAVDIAGRVILGSNDPDIVKLKEEKENYYKVWIIVILVVLAVIVLIYISIPRSSIKGGYANDYYRTAADGIFIGGFGGKGRFGGGFGGFSGGGGNFGGGGFSGKW